MKSPTSCVSWPDLTTLRFSYHRRRRQEIGEQNRTWRRQRKTPGLGETPGGWGAGMKLHGCLVAAAEEGPARQSVRPGIIPGEDDIQLAHAALADAGAATPDVVPTGAGTVFVNGAVGVEQVDHVVAVLIRPSRHLADATGQGHVAAGQRVPVGDATGGQVIGDALPADADRLHTRSDEGPTAVVAVLPGVAPGKRDADGIDALGVGASVDLSPAGPYGAEGAGGIIIFLDRAIVVQDVGDALTGLGTLDVAAQVDPADLVVI